MPRRLRLVDDAQTVNVRGELLRRYRTAAAQPARMTDERGVVLYHRENTCAQRLVADLEAGRPVVCSAWVLRDLQLPNVRRGRTYRVDRAGNVVEVTVVRDPADPTTIVGWAAVQP